MAIKAECGECGRVYNVRDELDGKKIRCKDCQAVIVVRAEPDDDWDESIEEEDLPTPVKKSVSKKANRRANGPSLPGPIIIALICLVLMMITQLLSVIGGLFLGDRIGSKPLESQGELIGYILRGVIQGAVFIGVFKGKSSTVTVSIVMATLTGLGLFIRLLIDLSTGADGPLHALIVTLCVLARVVYVICMITPSAKDYMRN